MYQKQKIDFLYLTEKLISFHKNLRFCVEFSKIVNFGDRTGFCGYPNKFERPVKLPISAHSHIKDHINMVNATIWSLFMLQWHIMTIFHSNILKM